MQERSQGKTQQQAAVKANLKSRKTVAKYEALGVLPSQMKEPRTYRTRPDPFADDWAMIEAKLTDAPELEAKALFDWLCEQEPDKYQEGQLRTFQRRVSSWKALNVSQIATLPQIRQPGEALQTDGTWMTELGVTIQGQPFQGLLIHSVLPYSNWEWGRLAQSESLVAVQLGLQSTLFKLGYVPQYHQTDNSSAATRRLGVYEAAEDGQEHPPSTGPSTSSGGASGRRSGRRFTEGYLHLLDHFGLEPRVIHVGSPNENGDIESANGNLKRALEQHLLLRGQRDFDSLEGYEQFLFGVMGKRNRLRQDRLNEEIAVMKPLNVSKLATRKRVKVRVNQASLIRVDKKSYSVPTGLIGKQVTVYIDEWWLDVYLGTQHIETLPRLIGQKDHRVNYRHLIDTLLRKPGGFRSYRYHEDLFPTLIFRRAWEQLQQWHSPRQADLIYLRILRLAARTLECDVALALDLLVESGQPWGEPDVEALVQPEPVAIPEVDRGPVELSQYDQLLPEFAHAPA
ncbi:MAG: IS21 family transposase [Anaerolineae bacterium]